MCWEYEDKYTKCFDEMAIDMGNGRLMYDLLEEYFGVEIVDEDKLRSVIFNALSIAHECGIIKPKE